MILWAILAVVIPWCAGGAILAAVSGRRLNAMHLIGAGYLLGQVIVMAALYLVLRVGGGGAHARWILLAFAAMAVLAIWKACARPNDTQKPVQRSPLSRGAKALTALLILLIISKLAPVIASTLFVPVRGDDAISIWLYRAKVVTLLDRLPLEPVEPYYLGGAAPAYPIFLSLAAAWTPMVSGQWHETLAVLPWPFFYVTILMLTAGGLRRLTGGLSAWIATYLVASLPLLLTHASRPGYADLPLSVFVAATILHLTLWRESRLRSEFALAIVFALAAACLKREGPPLALIAVAGFLLTNLNMIRSLPSVEKGVIAALVTAACVNCLAVVDFSEQSEAASQLAWQQGVLESLIRHAFQWSSLALFFPLVIVGLIAVAAFPNSAHRATTLTLVLAFIAFDAAVFLFTPQGRFAMNDQTPSRLFLQIAPASILLLASSLARRRIST